MIPMGLEEVREAVCGDWIARGREAEIAGVTIDTRTAAEGELFFAIRGQTHDGHEFLPAAAAAGCAAAVVGRDAAGDTPAEFPGGVIGVDDTTRALGDLASQVRGRLAATVLAVTGSNGKTTVKRMIDHILSRRLRGCAAPKSFNNEIGVPLTLLAAGAGDEYVVCEVGSNAPGEIASLGRIVRPDVAVITSVAQTHLEKLGSVRLVAAEKASLLGTLAAGGLGVVWADSPELAGAIRPYLCELVRFGASPQADLRLTRYEQRGWGGRLEVNGRTPVELPVPGRHNALNALAAMGAVRRLGFDVAEAAAALAGWPPGEMRLERAEAGAITIINDAYNANPASFAAAGEVLGQCAAERKVIVAGDMLELGRRAQALHLAAGRAAAAWGVDLLIGVGALGRYIARGAGEVGVRTATFPSPEEACKGVGRLLRRGDLVLIKASRALALDRLVDAIRSCAAAQAPTDAGADGN